MSDKDLKVTKVTDDKDAPVQKIAFAPGAEEGLSEDDMQEIMSMIQMFAMIMNTQADEGYVECPKCDGHVYFQFDEPEKFNFKCNSCEVKGDSSKLIDVEDMN